MCACVQTLKVGSDCAAPCLSHMAMSGWYSMPPPTRSPLPPPRSKDNLNRDGGEEGVCQRQQRRKSASQSATRWSTDHPNFFLFLPSIFPATSSNETQTQSFDKKKPKKKNQKNFSKPIFFLGSGACNLYSTSTSVGLRDYIPNVPAVRFNNMVREY